MSLQQQLIFLFSALGAINGFIVSGYFLLKRTEKRLSDYFLGGLLLMLSIRIIKSVFLFFNRELFEVFIQFGLTACFLIGPFLFLYVKSMTRPNADIKKSWWWHVLPYVLMITSFRFCYNYYDNRWLWRWFIEFIYKQWLFYIVLSAYLLRPIFKKLWARKEALIDEEFWLLNIFFGTAVIWLAYETSSYTSYIVGALSFTFLLYISILLWVYKRANKTISTDPPIKYANSALDEVDVAANMQKISQHILTQKPYLDPNLTLVKLSQQLGMSRKELSQTINQSKGQNYSSYIAELRIEEAKRLLALSEYANYKISAIAYDSGFNSLSSFNTYFKKIVGNTAQEYRKSL